MKRYLVLIYGDEQKWAAATPEWNAENGRGHRAFLDHAGTAVITGGELVPSSEAVCIRGDDPSGAIEAGPFVRTARGIGGFYLIDADDLDAAIRYARLIPEASAAGSGVEIREHIRP